jgi:cell division protein ZipA
MNELRWILLAAGIALVIGIYVWGTRERRRSGARGIHLPVRPDPSRPAPAAETPRLEPTVSLTTASAGPHVDTHRSEEVPRAEPPLRREPTFAERPAAEPPSPVRHEPMLQPAPKAEPPAAAAGKGARPPQKIVALRVTAAHPARFDGGQLRDVLMAAGFVHGRYDIFHRLDRDGRPVISLASLVEPGTFDPATMGNAAYPGVALFTVMPGPLPAGRAFDELLDTARAIAHRLGGHLQDDRGTPLSVQRVFALREGALAFERSLGSADAS